MNVSFVTQLTDVTLLKFFEACPDETHREQRQVGIRAMKFIGKFRRLT